mmetsp:Transcript_44000/g.44670  ORF Transcript_44000/g.44670 Transcript_44000/m.44670 type:complete len:100 (+) Transcript_44000:552-851(+)
MKRHYLHVMMLVGTETTRMTAFRFRARLLVIGGIRSCRRTFGFELSWLGRVMTTGVTLDLFILQSIVFILDHLINIGKGKIIAIITRKDDNKKQGKYSK